MARVWLDAGHGGTDPGACSSGLKESIIAMDVIRIVGNILSNKGINVGYSRQDETFIPLSTRASKANTYKADCFVSVHCNSAESVLAKGVETFCYKFKYRKLADTIHKNIISNTSLYNGNRGVKEGDFAVVRETNMDACLVELGFISNKEDRTILMNKKQEFATAIANGIFEYLGMSKVGIPSSTKQVIVSNLENTKANSLANDLKNKGYSVTIK